MIRRLEEALKEAQQHVEICPGGYEECEHEFNYNCANCDIELLANHSWLLTREFMNNPYCSACYEKIRPTSKW